MAGNLIVVLRRITTSNLALSSSEAHTVVANLVKTSVALFKAASHISIMFSGAALAQASGTIVESGQKTEIEILPPKEVKPGQSIILSQGQVFMFGATKAVMKDGVAIIYDYVTTVSTSNTRGLCAEVEQLWVMNYKKETESGGFSNALFRATNDAGALTESKRSVYTVGYSKDKDNIWRIRHCETLANPSKNLKFGSATAEMRMVDGVSRLVVSGSITNGSIYNSDVPNIVFSIFSRDVKSGSKVFPPPNLYIAAGSTLYFQIAYENPGSSATKYDIRFTDEPVDISLNN